MVYFFILKYRTIFIVPQNSILAMFHEQTATRIVLIFKVCQSILFVMSSTRYNIQRNVTIFLSTASPDVWKSGHRSHRVETIPMGWDGCVILQCTQHDRTRTVEQTELFSADGSVRGTQSEYHDCQLSCSASS